MLSGNQGARPIAFVVNNSLCLFNYLAFYPW